MVIASASVFCQLSERDQKIYDAMQKQDSLPRSLFLDEEDLPNLEKQIYPLGHIWVPSDPSYTDIIMLVDIRIKFKSSKKAVAFEQSVLADPKYGIEIDNHGINLQGSKSLKIYSASLSGAEVYREEDVQTFIYLFVVKKYVVMVALVCPKNVEAIKFEYLLKKLVERLK